MPEEIKRYKSNGKVYKIPVSKASSFLKDMPDAKEVELYTMGDKKYNIPLDKVESFLKDMPNAKLVKKKDNISTSSQSGIQENQEISTGSASENGNGGIFGKVKSVVADNAAKAEEHNSSMSTDGLVGEEGPELKPMPIKLGAQDNLASQLLSRNEAYEDQRKKNAISNAKKTIDIQSKQAKSEGISLEEYRDKGLRWAAEKYLSEEDFNQFQINDELEYYNSIAKDLDSENAENQEIFSKIKSLEKEKATFRKNKVENVYNRIKEIKEELKVATGSDRDELVEETKKLMSTIKPTLNPVETAKNIASQPQVEKMPGKTPMERIDNYYHSLMLERQELSQKMGMAGIVLSNIPIAGGISGATEDRDRLIDLDNRIAELTPVLALNRVALKEDNWLSQLGKGVVSSLISPGLSTTEQEQASTLYDMFSLTDNTESLDKSAIEAIESSYRQTLGEEVSATGGVTLGMLPSFALGGGLVKGVGLAAKGTKAANVVNKFSKMNRATKFLVGATETGLSYEAAGLLSTSSSVKEEASFISGFMGATFAKGAGRLVPQKLYNATMLKLLGTDAPKVHKLFAAAAQRSGQGFGEVFEEYGNEIGNIISESDGDLKKFIDLHQERFGDPNENIKFGLMTFGMGIGFGAATNAGKSFMAEHKEWLAEQSPEVQAEFNKIAGEIESDISSLSNEEIAQETEDINKEVNETKVSSEISESKTNKEPETLKVGDTIELSTEISEDTIDTTGNEAGESVTPIGEETREGTGDIEDKQADTEKRRQELESSREIETLYDLRKPIAEDSKEIISKIEEANELRKNAQAKSEQAAKETDEEKRIALNSESQSLNEKAQILDKEVKASRDNLIENTSIKQSIKSASSIGQRLLGKLRLTAKSNEWVSSMPISKEDFTKLEDATKRVTVKNIGEVTSNSEVIPDILLIEEINAKYDAELKALEQTKAETKIEPTREIATEVKPISEQTTEELEAKKDAPLDPGEDVDWEDFLNQQAEAEMARASVDSDVSKIETTQEPSVFSDKNGNTVVEGNEGIEVYNSKGDAVSGATREKVLRERAKSMSTSKMTTMHEGATDQEYNSTVASESNNPQEIAMAINAEKSKLDLVSDIDYKEGGDVEALIANSIGTADVNAESLIEEGVDPASLSAGAKSSFKIKSGSGISAQALVERINEDLATEGVNQEITIDNLKDFINTYNSLSDYKKKAASNLETETIDSIVALEGRFTEVTGLPATDKNINDIYEQITGPNKKESTTSKAKSTNTTKEKAKPRVTDYTKKGYGDSNKGVSNDKAVDLKTKFKAMMNNANSGLNPEALSIAAQLAAYHIEAGSRKFADFSKAMVADLGDVIKPHLVDLFNGGVKELKGIVPGLPPLYKKPNKKKKSEGPEQKKLSYIKRVMKSYKGQKELLDAVEAEGTTYETVSHKKVNPMADKIVDEALSMDNPDAALDAIADSIGETTYDEVTSNLYLPTLQSLIAHKIINHYYKTGDVKKFAKWSKRFADIGNSFGQFLSAMQNSAAPEALVNNAIASVQEGKSEALIGKEEEVQELQDFVEKILEEKAREIAKSDKLAEKLKEAVAKAKNAEKRAERAASGSTQRSTKQKAKSLADKIRSHKTDPSRFMFSQVVPITPVYDLALEIAAQVVDKGGTLIHAIEMGLRHLKKSKEYQAYQPHQQAKIDGIFDVDFKERYTEHFEDSGPDLDNIQDDIAKVIEDHFVKGNMKPTKLADVLIEKLGISQELANEIQEDIVSEIAAELDSRLKKKFGLDKDGKKKDKKAKKQATVVDSILKSIQYGALDQGTFQNHFAEKYGFANITPEQVNKLEEIIGYIFKYNGSEMSYRYKKKLADFVAAMAPMDSYKFFTIVEGLRIRAILSGFRTRFANITVGSMLGYTFGALPRYVLNARGYVAARKAWKEAGLKGTGRETFWDIYKTGFNMLDLNNQKFEDKGIDQGDALAHYFTNRTYSEIYADQKNPIMGALAVTGRTIMRMFEVSNFASAFDAIMTHKGAELEQFIEEYNKVFKEKGGKVWRKNSKDIVDTVRKNLNYNKIDKLKKEVDEEIKQMKADGDDIPKGHRKRRMLELMHEGRDSVKVLQAKEMMQQYTYMNTPDGALSKVHRVWSEKFKIKTSKEDKATGGAKFSKDFTKFILNAGLGTFMRMGVVTTQAMIRNFPVIGLAGLIYKKRVQKVVDSKGVTAYKFEKMSKRQVNHRIVEAAITHTIMGLVMTNMYNWDDEENEFKLNPDRMIEVTGNGDGDFWNRDFFRSKDRNGDVDDISPYTLRLKVNGDWINVMQTRFIPQLMTMGAILGGIRDREYLEEKGLKFESPKDALKISNDAIWDMAYSTTEQSFNNFPKFIKKGMFSAFKGKDGGSEAFGGMAADMFVKPVKSVLFPNVLRDTYFQGLALIQARERTGTSFNKSLSQNLYGLEYLSQWGNMIDVTDAFGNEIIHTSPISETIMEYPIVPEFINEYIFSDYLLKNNDRFNQPEWDVHSNFPGVIVPSFRPEGTEKEKMRKKEVYKKELGKLVRENASELSYLSRLEYEAYLQAYSKVAKAKAKISK